MKNPEHRVRTTKKLLRDALMSLLTKKPLRSITVKELCESAGLNRGKADHPEDYVRIARLDAAVAAFDAAHRDDPVWRYFELDGQIDAEMKAE